MKTNFTLEQQTELRRYQSDERWTVCYWCSDQHGYSANGGDRRVRGADRAVHHGIKGSEPWCSAGALHGTLSPHMWAGNRCWVVALEDAVRVDETKFSTTKRRVVIGEILPDQCIDPQVGIRIGIRDLTYANLRGANLWRANIWGANLRGANLKCANLVGSSRISQARISRSRISVPCLSTNLMTSRSAEPSYDPPD